MAGPHGTADDRRGARADAETVSGGRVGGRALWRSWRRSDIKHPGSDRIDQYRSWCGPWPNHGFWRRHSSFRARFRARDPFGARTGRYAVRSASRRIASRTAARRSTRSVGPAANGRWSGPAVWSHVSAGAGRPNRYPWPKVTPSSLTAASSASVSIPSAITSQWAASAKCRMPATTA